MQNGRGFLAKVGMTENFLMLHNQFYPMHPFTGTSSYATETFKSVCTFCMVNLDTNITKDVSAIVRSRLDRSVELPVNAFQKDDVTDMSINE